MPTAQRPYVICHMLPSIDGRIVIRDWNVPVATREYEKTTATFDADAWIIGRVSMESYAGQTRVPKQKNREPIAREDFIAKHDAASYAIAIDPSGKLTWRAGDIDGEHEGGGKINGTFLAADLIDELSILVGPVADGSIGTASLFDVENRRAPARNLKLLSIEKRPGDIVWLRYKVRR